MEKEIYELLKGAVNTVILTIGGGIIGFGSGIGLALFWLLKRKKWILMISDVLRGTPMLLQAMLVKILIGKYIPHLPLAMIVFGINSMAYSSQIILSGVNGVSSEIKHIAMSLGDTEYLAYKRVILPQALSNSIPALLNEFNSLLKETAIVGVVEVKDLLSTAEALGKRNNNELTMLIIAGAIYFTISYTVKTIVERKTQKGN